MKSRVLAICAIVAVVTAGLLLEMVRLAGASPIQRELTVHLDELPPETRPVRIALLSDLHVAKIGDTPDRLRETVRRLSAIHPDIVLLGGDFMTPEAEGGYGPETTVAPLSGLTAPLGVFAIFGNHDYRDIVPHFLSDELKKVGIQVLDNGAARAGPLTIVGLSDSITGHGNSALAIAAARKLGGLPVVLAHTPDDLIHLPPDVQLAFAGHTHCGQIVLPLIGALDWGTRSGSRFGCGVIREGTRINIITGGLGVSNIPLRLGAPPDFWIVTVVPKRAVSARPATQ